MFRKNVSIVLASIMLISNMGFAMNAHYCNGNKVSQNLSLGAADLDCGMNNMQSGCADESNHPEKNAFSNACCKNRHSVFQVDTQFEVIASSTSVNQNFVIALAQVLILKRIIDFLRFVAAANSGLMLATASKWVR